jgi:hypothetical protein
MALSIVPALVRGTVAAAAVYYTTFITGALDMGIVSPSFRVGGVLLLRRNPLGCLLATVLLVFTMIIGTNPAAGGALQQAAGAITIPQATAFTLPFLILTLIAAVLAARVFSGLAARPPGKQKTHPAGMGRGAARSRLEVAGLPLGAMALIALGNIAQLPGLEDQLHLHLAATGAEKLLRDDPDPRILAQYLSHGFTPPFTRIERFSTM